LVCFKHLNIKLQESDKNTPIEFKSVEFIHA